MKIFSYCKLLIEVDLASNQCKTHLYQLDTYTLFYIKTLYYVHTKTYFIVHCDVYLKINKEKRMLQVAAAGNSIFYCILYLFETFIRNFYCCFWYI